VATLDRSTGTTLLLVDDERVTALDVDRRVTSPVSIEGLGGRVLDARRTESGVVVVGDEARLLPTSDRDTAVTLPPGERVLGSAADDRVWLVTSEPTGISLLREVDLAAAPRVTREVQVAGYVAGVVDQGLVVERPAGVLEIVDPDTGAVAHRVDEGTQFVATGDELLVTRPASCATSCEITIDDLATGRRQRAGVTLGGGAGEVAAFSPDQDHLVVLRSDGVETRGAVLDVRLGTVTRVRLRGLGRNATAAPVAAWSRDGRWLFVATAPAGIDAVDTDGRVYRLDAELGEFDALVTR
jgi:hypothetical protein